MLKFLLLCVLFGFEGRVYVVVKFALILLLLCALLCVSLYVCLVVVCCRVGLCVFVFLSMVVCFAS